VKGNVQHRAEPSHAERVAAYDSEERKQVGQAVAKECGGALQAAAAFPITQWVYCSGDVTAQPIPA